VVANTQASIEILQAVTSSECRFDADILHDVSEPAPVALPLECEEDPAVVQNVTTWESECPLTSSDEQAAANTECRSDAESLQDLPLAPVANMEAVPVPECCEDAATSIEILHDLHAATSSECRFDADSLHDVSETAPVAMPLECEGDPAVVHKVTTRESECRVDAFSSSDEQVVANTECRSDAEIPHDSPLAPVANIEAVPVLECCEDAAASIETLHVVTNPDCRSDADISHDVSKAAPAAIPLECEEVTAEVHKVTAREIECRVDAPSSSDEQVVANTECRSDAGTLHDDPETAPELQDHLEIVPESHEVRANLWTCDCPVCLSRRMYFRALETVIDPLCLPGVGGAAKSEMCGELCARLAARSWLSAADWRSVLGRLVEKVRDEMPAVVHACRGSRGEGAQRQYARFLDSLEALFCELKRPPV
jgi:hypothetical protein